MSQIAGSITAILSALIGVAILSVLVSRNSNTSDVLNAGSNAFSNLLSKAMGNS